MSDGSKKKILGMVFRAIVQAVDDTAALQLLKISGLADEVREKVTRLGQYGFASSPPPGSDAVALSVGGSREHIVIVATDSKGRRKTLLAGEAAIYNELTGDEILLKADGKILLGAGATDPVVRKSDLEALASTFNGHSHRYSWTGTAGSSTTAGGPSHTATASEKVFSL